MAEQERRAMDSRISRLVEDISETKNQLIVDAGNIRQQLIVDAGHVKDQLIEAAGMVDKQRSEDMRHIKEQLDDNTKITTQVRDVLASFKILASITKWLTIMAVFITSALALVKGVIGFNDITPR